MYETSTMARFTAIVASSRRRAFLGIVVAGAVILSVLLLPTTKEHPPRYLVGGVAAAVATTSSNYFKVYKKSSRQSTSKAAVYDCVLYNLWTKSRHPSDFPDNAHWSKAVFASHDDGYVMFKPGLRLRPASKKVSYRFLRISRM